MFNFFKAFAFLFLITSLMALGGCGEKTSKEQFIDLLEKDFRNGFSPDDIAFKIMTEGYVKLPGFAYGLDEDFDLESFELENAQYEREVTELVANIQNRRCEDIWALIGVEPLETQDSDNEVIGTFYMDGICVDKNLEIAANIFKRALTPDKVNPIVAAKLGSLYWKGEGVAINKELAEDYFQKAVFDIGSEYFSLREGDPFVDASDSLDFKIWGLTYSQMTISFSPIETDPWDLPKPLEEKILWLEDLVKDNGQPIVEVAKQMLTGEGEYSKDMETALIWMSSAGVYLGNEEARYLAPLWQMDRNICQERNQLKSLIDCDSEFSYGLFFMEFAAFEGDEKAIAFLIDLFANHPERKWADWNLYQYFLLACKNGLSPDSEKFEKAKKALSPLEQDIIEKWVERENFRSISEKLP